MHFEIAMPIETAILKTPSTNKSIKLRIHHQDVIVDALDVRNNKIKGDLDATLNVTKRYKMRAIIIYYH